LRKRIQYVNDEIDDEAAIGVAAGGAAEEGGAVGSACDGVGDAVLGEDGGVVAGVGERVPEAEDGVVAPGREAGQGGGDQCPCPSKVRDEKEQEGRDGAQQLAHLDVWSRRNDTLTGIAIQRWKKDSIDVEVPPFWGIISTT
jgi:hypothetical protein